jgi:PAS domain S-box-containing protein
MRKVLRAIDPTSVMPSRVKHAFDSLSEGLILVDNKERIVMANAAIARRLQCKEESLLGMKASGLQWHGAKTFDKSVYFPWQEAGDTGKMVYGFPMAISPDGKEERIFMVNSAPIIDGDGGLLGVLTTFDDVTELERKNIQLSETIGQLELSRDQVQLQNVELERLATRDPMTGCFNRRAFFAKAEEMFAAAKAQETRLACVMTDIDKFKLVNDTYGHGVGDKVITYYAKMLQLILRGDDLLCRYGGEEFCILLPTCDSDAAASVAERPARECV